MGEDMVLSHTFPFFIAQSLRSGICTGGDLYSIVFFSLRNHSDITYTVLLYSIQKIMTANHTVSQQKLTFTCN